MARKKDSNKKLKIAVAMSGGVDSSVAAKLLADQGHEVIGIFLRFWKEKNRNNPPSPPPRLAESETGLYQGGTAEGVFENKCCSNQAWLDARRVADKIGMPIYTFDFTKIFKKQVVDNFLDEHASGRTPNPCVRCNKAVKLGQLLKYATSLGFDYVATGHYARLRRKFPNPNDQFPKNTNTEHIYKLCMARDKNKDQSYFLYTLNQKQLSHLLFPLGNYTKPQVRALAKKFKLAVAEKPESQEICFIADKNHNEFLQRHLKLKAGPIKLLTTPLDKGGLGGIKPPVKAIIPPTPFIKGESEIIGRHQGLPLFTIGQRRGIKIGGGPFYAVKMDYKTNTLFVTNNKNSPEIYSSKLVAEKVSWLSGQAPKLPLKCQAVVRYRQQPVSCEITKNKNNFTVNFKQPLRAIAPGQSVVFYLNREVLGGGIIK